MENIEIKISECMDCKAVAPKFYDENNVFQTGEFIERGEVGYDFTIYQNGNLFPSHGLCSPCYDIRTEKMAEERAAYIRSKQAI